MVNGERGERGREKWAGREENAGKVCKIAQWQPQEEACVQCVPLCLGLPSKALPVSHVPWYVHGWNGGD